MSDTNIPSEVLAAIAMAIFDDQDQHDVESNVLTIKRVSQDYLPWAEKANLMLRLPLRK
ncbi:MAG: hypothetical protein QM654_16170 [Dysgonamonadaceae bacterium]